jgi:hypothetical protein
LRFVDKRHDDTPATKGLHAWTEVTGRLRPSERPVAPAGSSHNADETLDDQRDGGDEDRQGPGDAGDEAGEDEGSIPTEGDDNNVKENRKPIH